MQTASIDTNSLCGAMEFFDTQLPGLAERMCLCTETRAVFERLFKEALRKSADTICACRQSGMAAPTNEGRALLDFLGDTAVGPESQLIGSEHVARALAFMREGGNVLMVQNHRSGADTVAWDKLVNRHFNGAAREFGYMAGHVVAFYLIPHTIISGITRFQIFSQKYKDQADEVGLTLTEMMGQNVRALQAVARWIRTGGKFVGLYPEGGRSECGLLEGNHQTAKIGEIIAAGSPRGLMILPTYVDGTTSILPVVRGADEFQRFICHVRRGNATVTCGEPIRWEDLQPDATPPATAGEEGRRTKEARRRHIHAQTMRAIARLAPSVEAKGVWS